MIKIKYLKYWDVNNLYCWTKSKKLPLNGFPWVENISEFDESLISYNEKSHEEIIEEGYFLEVDVVEVHAKIHDLHHDLSYLLEKIKIEKVEQLVTSLHDKTEDDFEKDFFKLSNAVFRKSMESARKYRDIKLVTTERRRIFQREDPIK